MLAIVTLFFQLSALSPMHSPRHFEGLPLAIFRSLNWLSIPLRKHPDSSSLQSELRRIYRIWVALVELFAGNKAVSRQFLNAPNRALDRRAPIEFIETGDLSPLEIYVDSMTARQPI
jgi:uncharacterized protein (DUF2384 family)